MDDIVLLANTPTQAESQLHRLEQAAGVIGLHVSIEKKEYMCFNNKGDISTLINDFLKLLDNLIYIGGIISSTEKDINVWLAQVWDAINRLSIKWKSNLFDKIKQFFPSRGHVNSTIWMHHMDADKEYGEIATQ